MSFTEFNHGAIKNKVMWKQYYFSVIWIIIYLSIFFSYKKCQTVREVFARQLMQISGVSGDKAAAILELYGTVSRCDSLCLQF